MSDNRYFKEALTDFAFDAAYGDSIRHLYDRGYTPKQIRKHLGAQALTEQRIQEVIEKYAGTNRNYAGDLNNSRYLNGADGLPEENNVPRKTSPNELNNNRDYEFIREYDSYGRSSFVRRKKEP